MLHANTSQQYVLVVNHSKVFDKVIDKVQVKVAGKDLNFKQGIPDDAIGLEMPDILEMPDELEMI